MKKLQTGVRNARHVTHYSFGNGNIKILKDLLKEKRSKKNKSVVFFVDHYFEGKKEFIDQLPVEQQDSLIYVDSSTEPTTTSIDKQTDQIRKKHDQIPCAMVGIGGGATMDTAKAVANLLSNGGKAEDYQGWDLVKNPAVYKIAIPTLSGTGAEATRTCVMINERTGSKLGMNSDYTVYDQVILDPDLTETVPRDQYFWTGMDAYIHCIESLSGNYRNAIGDAFSRQTLSLCREVFFSEDIQSPENREKLMVASYLGGCAIASSYVGIIHPFSAGLSVVLGTHHCVSNCITMRAMEEFYPKEYDEFWTMVEQQGIHIPEGLCRELSEEQYNLLYDSTVIHEKPLTNALGGKFRKILTPEKVKEIFKLM